MKHFYWISFFPALASWYLEENYPVKIAVAAGLGLAVLEILLEKFFVKHVHKLSKMNFFLLLFLGGLSLLGDEGIWFKLQPMFTGLGMGGYILYDSIRGPGLLLLMMEEMGREPPPKEVWGGIEKHLGGFLICYGCFMGGIAFLGTTETWLLFKTLYFYLIFFVFMFFESFLMRKRMKRHIENQKKAQLFRNL